MIKISKIALFVCVAWISSIVLLRGLTIPASEDTTSYQTRITTAASNASSLSVDPARNSYLYFNLDNIPQDAVVRFANLRIYVPSVRFRGSGASVHKVLGQWNEAVSGVEPTYDPTPIAAFPGESLGSRRFVTVDVTTLVQEWVSGATENEGVVIRATRGLDSKSQLATFTISAKDGPFVGLPAHLEIELWDDTLRADADNPVPESAIGFAQLSKEIRELLTPAFKPALTIEDGTAGKKLQLETFGIFGPKGVGFEWYKDGKAVDLGFASVIEGNAVRLDTSLLGSGSYALLASNGPATVMSEPIAVSNKVVDIGRGLVLYMPFDGDAQDKSGQSNHGVVDGAKLTTDRFGSANSAYYFNGASKIRVEHKTTLNPFPMTVSCWFQTTDVNPGYMVEKYENATWNGWSLAVGDVEASGNATTKAAATGFFLRTRQNYVIGGYDNQASFGGGGPLNDGRWHQAIMVLDSQGGRVFVDGKLVDTHPWVGPAGAPTGSWPLYIGHYPRNMQAMGPLDNPDFKGSIDDVRVYSRALGESEVLELFNVEKPLPLQDADFVKIASDGPVSLGFPDEEIAVQLDEYLIAKDEMTYGTWNAVVDAAKLNLEWILPKGLKGSSQDSATDGHPVTGINFVQVALWCNAASLIGKLEPCYFVFNAEGQKVLLKPDTFEFADVRGIFWEKNAGGYRLPTGDEWEVAARGGRKSQTYPWGNEEPSTLNSNWIMAAGYPNATTAVGTYPRNGYGLSDCAGNVNEMTWDISLAPGEEVPDVIKVKLIIRGSAFNAGWKPKISGYGWDMAISWGESGVNGFRVARSSPQRFKMVEIPAQESVPLGFPATSPEVNVKVSAYRIATDETTFAVWSSIVKSAKDTLGWTLAAGVQGSGAPGLSGQHPVTGVTFQEVAVWLNAASKLENLEPVYFTYDADGKRVPLTPDTVNQVNDNGIYWEKSASGYRFPTGDEWEVAARGGLKNRTYPWGEESPSTTNTNWVWADGYPKTTTPVGTYARNGYGLSDCAGNVYEMTWDTSLLPGSGVLDLIKGNALVRGGAWNQGYLPKISGLGWDLPISWDKRTEYGFRIARGALRDMVLVDGGTLPASSGLGALNVPTFYIGKTEVTWGDWKAVQTWAVANGYPDLANVGTGLSDKHPVTQLNWYGAIKWCNARSEKEGKAPVYMTGGNVYRTGQVAPDEILSADGYRLPSEKEWEFAARGGVQTKGYTYSGSNDLDKVGWFAGNPGDYAREVGKKQANELGIYDMSGNVWEWCGGGYAGANTRQAVRGGNWSSIEETCTVSRRMSFEAWNREYYRIGFRVATSGEYALAITAQPTISTDGAKISVQADGVGTLTYQWLRNGVAINGGNSSQLTTEALQSGTYAVVVSNGFASRTSGGMKYINWRSNTYSFVQGIFTWQQAKADAEAKGGYLVTITSAAELNAVQSQLGSNFDKSLWLGASIAPGRPWEWVTGEAFVFNNGEPVSFNVTADLAEPERALRKWPSWQFSLNTWDDVSAFASANSSIEGYILEIERN